MEFEVVLQIAGTMRTLTVRVDAESAAEAEERVGEFMAAIRENGESPVEVTAS